MDNGKDANRYGDHSGLRDKLLEQFQPLQEKLCSALEDSQDLLTQFRRNTSLAGILDAPMISVQLMKGVDALFGSPSPKIVQRGQNTLQKPISWPDIVTASNCKIENKEAGIFHYHLDDVEAIAELSEFQHSIVLSGILQKLTQPWSYKRDVQTELYTLSSIAETAGLSIQLASRILEVNKKIIGQADQRSRVLRDLLKQWKEPLSYRGPLSLISGKAQRQHCSGHAESPVRGGSHRAASSNNKEPKRPRLTWTERKWRSPLTQTLTRARFYQRKTALATRKRVHRSAGPVGMGVHRTNMLHRRLCRRVTLSGQPMPSSTISFVQTQSTNDQQRTCLENPDPRVQNNFHTRLSGSPSDNSENCKKSSGEANKEWANNQLEIQYGPRELGWRPAPMGSQAHLATEWPAANVRTGPSGEDGGHAKAPLGTTLITSPGNNADLPSLGSTITDKCHPEPTSDSIPVAVRNLSSIEAPSCLKDTVYQGPGGINLIDGISSSPTGSLDIPPNLMGGERKDVAVTIAPTQAPTLKPQWTKSRNRRWATEDLERLPFWFMDRAHLTEDEIEAAFRVDFQHERSFRAIHAAFKKQMRIAHEASHVNTAGGRGPDTHSPVSYSVTANSIRPPISQTGSGPPNDSQGTPPEASTPEEFPVMTGYPDNIEMSPDRADLTRSPSTISYRANSAENTPFSPSFYDHGK